MGARRVAVKLFVAAAVLAVPGTAHAAPCPPVRPIAFTASTPTAFTLGVASGEVTPTSAKFWARGRSSGRYRFAISTDHCFEPEVTRRTTVRTSAADDRTLHVRVGRLRPNTRYWYRFAFGRSLSRTGTFRTAPSASSTRTIRFAWSGDTDAQPARGEHTPYYNRFGNQNFLAYRSMVRERNDFNINLGDTIYSDSEVGSDLQGGVFAGFAPALTRKEKWAKYRMNIALPNLQSIRGTTSLYSNPDDHEYLNDYGPGQLLTARNHAGKIIRVRSSTVYQPGVEAFRDYTPSTYSKKLGFYRTFRWGKNVQIFILDERSFRSPPAGSPTIHSCDNPSTHQPDLAPTLPHDRRELYGALAPSLHQPVSPKCLATIRSSRRTLLGKAQLARFLHDIKASKATFKVVINPVTIKQFYALPYDGWEGYEHERRLVLHQLQAHVKHSIFLTTDIHASLAATAKYQTFEPGGVKDSGIWDVSTGPVATRTYQREISAALGENGDLAPSAKAIDAGIFTPALPAGLGMSCAEINTFSYGEITATRRRLTVSLRDQSGAPLVDQSPAPHVCPPIVLHAP